MEYEFYHSYSELYHHGILGMKWGVRRFQNKDGSLTPAGEKRYAKEQYKSTKKTLKEARRADRANADADYEKETAEVTNKIKKVDAEYAKKENSINKYYDNEIEKEQKNRENIKNEMDFWGLDSQFYSEYRDAYDQSSQKIFELNLRKSQAIRENRVTRDNAKINIDSKYAEIIETANARREAAYIEAGKKYVEGMKAAKIAYNAARK